MPLSEGGMGQVDLCVREGGSFKRLYAMKRLKPGVREDAECRAMFVQEARLAGLVHHPNVVSVLDVGEDQGGPFLVMEYVEGVTVSDVLRAAQQSAIPIPLSVCLEIVAQAARGLYQAHGQTGHDGQALNLVHRDVSPHNILVDFHGVARVTDFGIARATGSKHHTSTGVLKGKLGYMAPEVLQFAPLDPRTDIFALGVVLFELLAGRRLYVGDDRERASRIVNEPPPDIGEERRDVPPDTQALVVSMLAKDPDERPESALHVAERLEAELHRLRDVEDYCSLAEHIEEQFSGVRRARQREVQAFLDARVEAPAPRRSRRGIVVGGVACALAAGAGSWWLRAPAQPAEVDKAAAAAAPEEVEEEPFVQIELRSSPSGARVLGEGIDMETPASFTLPRGNEAVEFEIRRRGYRTKRLEVVPREAAHFDVTLVRLRRRRTKRAPSGLTELWD